MIAIHAVPAEDDARFTTTLSDIQRAESGLAQLTEDNLAVIDALVRQDIATVKRRNSTTSFGTFTERRSVHEREIAGLGRLSPVQTARLDGLIALRVFPPPAYQLNAEHNSSTASPVKPVSRERGLEIHGSMSLTYGWSKAGSTRGGAMVVTAQDPAGRFKISIGYGEYSGRGPTPYLGSRDDFYRYRPGVDHPQLEP